MPRLHEGRIRDDGADRRKGQRARDQILRAVQQNAHRKIALFACLDRNRVGAAAAAARMSSSRSILLGTFLHLIRFGLMSGFGRPG